MTYVRGQYIAVGDAQESAIAQVLAAFLPKLHEIQAAGDANAQAQVDAIIKDATGSAAPPVTTTVSGSKSSSSVTAADFTIIGGSVAKPKNFPALTAAKDLQMQLNRVAKAKGLGKIVVDGDIGPGTVGLVGRIASVCGGAAESLTTIVSHVPSLTSSVKACADKIGAPPPTATEVANASSAGAISVPTPGGAIAFKPPGAKAGIFETVKALPDTVKLAGGGALVLGGLYLFTRFAKRRRAALAPAAPVSNPYRRRRRRRRR